MGIKRFLLFGFIFFLVLLTGLISFWLSFKRTISLDNPEKEKTSVTKTEVKKDEPIFSFAVFGDTEIQGLDDEAMIFQKIIKGINADKEIIFVIHTGDLTSKGTKYQFDRFSEFADQLEISLYTTLGNNDIATDRYGTYYEDLFGKSYYSFDFEDCHFIALDNSSAYYGFDRKQRKWLEEDLEENSQQRFFIVMHRPLNVPLASAVIEGGNELSSDNINAFLKIINPYSDKILQIFTGHIHSFLEYTLADKIPVTVSGGGGAAPQVKIIKEDYHYLKVQVFEDKIKIQKLSV